MQCAFTKGALRRLETWYRYFINKLINPWNFVARYFWQTHLVILVSNKGMPCTITSRVTKLTPKTQTRTNVLLEIGSTENRTHHQAPIVLIAGLPRSSKFKSCLYLWILFVYTNNFYCNIPIFLEQHCSWSTRTYFFLHILSEKETRK